MTFSSLCKKKFFKNIPILDDIKLNKFANEIFSLVFTGMGGRYTRLRILCEIIDIPLNAREISKKLNVDYKTISYNLAILLKNNLIIKNGNPYGAVYYPSEIVTSNLPTLYLVIRKAEAKLDKLEKKYID